MSNITIIPARPQLANSQQNETEKPKLRVAAYCRVSTDSDEQATSYETQVSHYTEQITRNPEWAFAGIYADDGISGTNTKKREEFNRMIADCMDGKIDMIITKSISRFARNTLDCLKYIRQLKERNIPVFFEKENINTLDAKGEVLLTIMASLAQQESQSLSQNVKLGLQFRYQRGEVQVNHSRFLGYTKDENGRLVIDPEHTNRRRKSTLAYKHGCKDTAQRKVYGRCTSAKDIHGGLSFQKAHKEQRNIAAVLCRERPRSYYSKRDFYAGAGRTCASQACKGQSEREKARFQQ